MLRRLDVISRSPCLDDYGRVTGDSEVMGWDGTPVAAGQKSGSRKCAADECCSHSDLLEAGLGTARQSAEGSRITSCFAGGTGAIGFRFTFS